MTHDELLELINRKNHSQGMVIHVDTFRDVLRAVVELATWDVRDTEPWQDDAEYNAGYNNAMYEVLQAIEKELE